LQNLQFGFTIATYKKYRKEPVLNILIVDDDDFTMELIKRKIQNWGYNKIFTLDNGRDALDFLNKRTKPFLVIMDWMMPGLNGNEVYLELPEPNEPLLYKILLTAKNTTEDMHFGLTCGAHKYLTKPIDFSDLEIALKEGKAFLKNHFSE